MMAKLTHHSLVSGEWGVCVSALMSEVSLSTWVAGTMGDVVQARDVACRQRDRRLSPASRLRAEGLGIQRQMGVESGKSASVMLRCVMEAFCDV